MKIAWLIALAGLLCTPVRADAADDGALVVRMEGTVEYQAEGDPEAWFPAEPLQLARIQDKFKLHDGAMLELVFLGTGRRQTWTCTDTLTVGTRGATSILPGCTPEQDDFGEELAVLVTTDVIPRDATKERSGSVSLLSAVLRSDSEPSPTVVREQSLMSHDFGSGLGNEEAAAIRAAVAPSRARLDSAPMDDDMARRDRNGAPTLSPTCLADPASESEARRKYRTLKSNVDASDPLPDVLLALYFWQRCEYSQVKEILEPVVEDCDRCSGAQLILDKARTQIDGQPAQDGSVETLQDYASPH